MLRINKEQKMAVLTNELEQMVDNEIQILVYFGCRRKFRETRKSGQSKLPSEMLRSSYDNVLSWKEHCFLCEKAVDLKHSEKSNITNVRAIPILQNMKAIANEREDKWHDLVLGRLKCCNDLVVVEHEDQRIVCRILTIQKQVG